MRQIYWQSKPLALAVKEYEGTAWLSLGELVEALNGHLQDLPGGAVGFCLPDDRCLPLGAGDIYEDEGEKLVRLSALTPLGVVTDGIQPVDQILLGDPMPDLTFTHLQGGLLALRDLIGKPAILFAWASW